MQMSRNRLWVFVEGLIDRTFYDNICRQTLSQVGVKHCVALAQELPGHTGNGKPALLQFHNMLKDEGSLVMSLGSSVTTAIFFLDKDVDDLLGASVVSPHIAYTRHYGLENYLFRYGDLATAIEAAACIDREAVERQLRARGHDWTTTAAENWKEWVTYCLFVKSQMTGERNYGVTSQFNNGAYTPIDPAVRNAIISSARLRSPLSAADFDREYAATEALVENLYQSQEFDAVFNGKWYVYFLSKDAERAAGGRQFNRSGLNDRLLSTLLMTLDYSEVWCSGICDTVRRMSALVT